MEKQDEKIEKPGMIWRIISFVPLFNWVSLVYLWWKYNNTYCLICGVIAALFSVRITRFTPAAWYFVVVCYMVGVTKIGKTQTKKKAKKKEEISYRFLWEMKMFALKTGKETAFVPFQEETPTYAKMKKQQKEWYFYWRNEVRQGNYLETDYSYILIYIYELLSGIGWKDAKDGYDKLLQLWTVYHEAHPELNNELCTWIVDFVLFYRLENVELPIPNLKLPSQKILKNLMIEKYVNTKPLNLPFSLIDAMTEYSLVDSKFYQDGNAELMENVIPQVISLVDKSLRETHKQGIMTLYGPNIAEEINYPIFKNALSEYTGRKLKITVKPYTSHKPLCEFVNEIVRYTENQLREQQEYRWKLRNIEVDEEFARMIDKFLMN